MPVETLDIVVVGGGLVGLCAAISLADAGNTVGLCAPNTDINDPRTTALLDDSVDFLSNLGVWGEIAGAAHPLRVMRLIDASQRLLRFQQTDFRAGEIGLDAFGYNLRNADLLEVFQRKIAETESITLIEGAVGELVNLENGDVRVLISVSGQAKPVELQARFVVGADGRNSVVRENALPGIREWTYPQNAIVLDFEHTLESGYVSTEFHTPTGPFTIVPQSANRAGLVWLENPQTASEIVMLDRLELDRLLEDRMQSFLGKVRTVTNPQMFPMRGLIANRFGDGRFALIGEAAHVFPPIGAQGFNLGIRDIRDLVQALSQFSMNENPGSQFHKMRSSDVNSRTVGVDLLNRSLLSDFLPLQVLRSIGMHALGNISPLRKQAMKMGIAPARLF